MTRLFALNINENGTAYVPGEMSEILGCLEKERYYIYETKEGRYFLTKEFNDYCDVVMTGKQALRIPEHMMKALECGSKIFALVRDDKIEFLRADVCGNTLCMPDFLKEAAACLTDKSASAAEALEAMGKFALTLETEYKIPKREMVLMKIYHRILLLEAMNYFNSDERA